MSSRKAPVLLSHFLSVEKLTTQQVFSLLQRAQDFKNSPTRPEFIREINVANLFLKIQHGPNLALRWQNKNWD